ncbi:Tex-like N-terminal domain-containing protein [Thermostilla marina]
MSNTEVTITMRQLIRGLGISSKQAQAVVDLLDAGNTVPFITRYRKDQTGGLDEEQIRRIQKRLIKLRQLAERKKTILRSIESQGKLTESLAKRIRAAGSLKRLEDLYLPYKPRKQTLAAQARNRGLDHLAREILEADPAAADLDARAADYVNPDKGVNTAAEALLGAGHIIAEQFSERIELREKLREILERTGVLHSTRIGGDETPSPSENAKSTAAATKTAEHDSSESAATESKAVEPSSAKTASDASPESETDAVVSDKTTDDAESAEAIDQAQPTAPSEAGSEPKETTATEADALAAGEAPTAADPATNDDADDGDSPEDDTTVSAEMPPDESADEPAEEGFEPIVPQSTDGSRTGSETPPPEEETTRSVDDAASADQTKSDSESSLTETSQATEVGEAAEQPTSAPSASEPKTAPKQQKLSKAEARKRAKERKKKKKEERKVKAFADYFDYHEAIRKIPPHRVLAINRGERSKVLRVRIEADTEAMIAVAEEECVPKDHPHAEFLKGCARDALSRLIYPSLEREARRDLTDRAESHAVDVFAKNLRKLLLQPPVRDRRVLAIDPGYRSGCKLAALDQFGNVLDVGVISLIGKAEKREQAKEKIIALVERYHLSIIAIGNGTGCRETELFIAELLENELAGRGLAYAIVNEAGASVYSTSPLGREELPEFDASVRGAVSIGRRLLDPLSELVKIDPGNIGVGLYQHDVKAKHLRESLDAVVESCVNYVGVDVNTASPALLRYVSGLNQLTARRVYEYRRANGPFRNREQLRNVPGIGETTFVQAAGFLKINGDNPLDATWIHPESYPLAERLMEKLGITAEEIIRGDKAELLESKIREIDVDQLAEELGAGKLTVRDILQQFMRPGRDPREDIPRPAFKEGVLKLEDLEVGMELSGTVLNVVDFGAFIDIGMHDSGLVHVSQLANRYIRDPHEVVSVGDIVRVWVIGVDKERRRVSLTMIPPGTQQKKRSEPRERRDDKKTSREQGRSKRREDRRGGKGGERRREHHGRRRTPPKPVKPISSEMIEGKEPLRSFSDLLQYAAVKGIVPQAASDGKESKKRKKKKGKKDGGQPAQATPPASQSSTESDSTAAENPTDEKEGRGDQGQTGSPGAPPEKEN